MSDKLQCVGYGEVEIVERGSATGLSKIKLASGAETTVSTSYLPPEKPEKAEAKKADKDK